MSRTKDQWIEETGGFRFGESQEMFQKRVQRIKFLQEKAKAGTLTVADVDELAALKGVKSDDE